MSITHPIAEPQATAAERAVVTTIKRRSVWGDYSQLFKARVTSLIVMTAWAGAYMASVASGVSAVSWTLLNALWGIGLTSAGAAALNEVVERDLDARMRRTKDRPLPSGRMSLTAGLTAGLAAVIV